MTSHIETLQRQRQAARRAGIAATKAALARRDSLDDRRYRVAAAFLLGVARANDPEVARRDYHHELCFYGIRPISKLSATQTAAAGDSTPSRFGTRRAS